MPLPKSHLDVEFRGLGPPLGAEAEGQRADLFLARRFPFNSRSAWRELCERGELLVNGRAMRASRRLRAGDQLAVFHPLSAEPEVDDRIELIADLGSVIAIYKPGNLPMHESGLFRRRTLRALVSERYGPNWEPVHRLDRETSGIVVFASTHQARRGLSLAFEHKQVEKRYLAIVIGASSWDELSVRQPIALDENERRPRYLVHPKGTAAHTDFAVLERANSATLIEARPRTGKTNQIRVHAAWTGHPLVGDKIYHPDPRVYDAYHAYGDTPKVQRLAGFNRHALHAAELTFAHPETNQRVHLEAALPLDLVGLWGSFQ